MIFSCTFRQTVSVVNLPRSSVGSGETIARSRNSERCLRRLLSRDYINAFRRLRIGRCPPPFLTVHPTHNQMDVWNVTWGPLRVSAAYDYRKHLSSYFGKRIFRAAWAEKRRREGFFGAGRDNNGEVRSENEWEPGGTTACLYSQTLKIHVDGPFCRVVLQSCSQTSFCFFRSCPFSFFSDLAPFFVVSKTLLCISYGRKDMAVRSKECSHFDVSQFEVLIVRWMSKCQNVSIKIIKLYTWCKFLIYFNYQFNFKYKMFQIYAKYSVIL